MKIQRILLGAGVAAFVCGVASQASAQVGHLYGYYNGTWTPLTVDSGGNMTATCTVSTVIEDAAETGGMALMAAGGVVRAGKTGSSATAGDNATVNVDAAGGLWNASDQIEDSAETALTPLSMAGAVRRDTAGSSSTTDGDNSTINTDATGHLWVMPNILTVAGTTAVVEDAAETAAGNLLPIGVVVRAGKTGSTASAADNATLNVTTEGGLWNAPDQIEDVAETAATPLSMAGAVRRDAAASSSTTDGDNSTINTDSLGRLWVTGSAVEDVAETAAGALNMAGAVRRDVAASSSTTDGDNSTFNTDALGRLWIAPWARAVAYGSSPTAVTAAVFGAHIADLEGRPYVNTSHPRAINCVLSTTATTSTQVTGCELVASNSIYITSIQVAGDAANATSTPWIVQSGTSTACTGPRILVSGFHPAVSGNTMTFPVPIKVVVAEGLCLLDGTAGTKTVSIQGYVAP